MTLFTLLFITTFVYSLSFPTQKFDCNSLKTEDCHSNQKLILKCEKFDLCIKPTNTSKTTDLCLFCQKIAKEAISHFDDEEDEEGELEFEFCDSSNSSCIAIVDKIYDYLEKYRYEDLPSYIQVCRGVKMCENSLMKQVSFVVVVIVVVIYICCLGVETWRTVNNNNHFPSIFSCLLCLPLLINKLLCRHKFSCLLAKYECTQACCCLLFPCCS